MLLTRTSSAIAAFFSRLIHVGQEILQLQVVCDELETDGRDTILQKFLLQIANTNLCKVLEPLRQELRQLPYKKLL